MEKIYVAEKPLSRNVTENVRRNWHSGERDAILIYLGAIDLRKEGIDVEVLTFLVMYAIMEV